MRKPGGSVLSTSARSAIAWRPGSPAAVLSGRILPAYGSVDAGALAGAKDGAGAASPGAGSWILG